MKTVRPTYVEAIAWLAHFATDNGEPSDMAMRPLTMLVADMFHVAPETIVNAVLAKRRKLEKEVC